MRARVAPMLILAAMLVVLFWLLKTGGRQAETLSTPFPGTVLSAHATGGKCIKDGCPFSYRVQITNPTDGNANVMECMLQVPSHWLSINSFPAGLGILAHATRMVTARNFLPNPVPAARTLVGQGLTCTGLDWHGNPPI